MNSFFNFLIFLTFFSSACCTLIIAKILYFSAKNDVVIVRNWLGHFQWAKMLEIAGEGENKQKVKNAMRYEKLAKAFGLFFILISIFKVFVLPFII